MRKDDKWYFMNLINTKWSKQDVKDFKSEIKSVKKANQDKCYYALNYAYMFSGLKTYQDLIGIVKDWSKEL